MPKNIHSVLMLCVSLIMLMSCQKVIQLELNTSSSQIVIQGNVYDQVGSDTITISRSVNFDQSNNYPAVSGALVSIHDDTGNAETLTEITPGTYITSVIHGKPGRTYTLNVKSGGQTYTATSTMPMPVELRSVYFKNSLFGNEKVVYVNFHDSIFVKNYYRLVEFVNNIKQDQFSVADDKLYDGQIMNYQFRGTNTDTKLESGTLITVWLESVDQGVYEYFRTAGSGGRGQSASPANPSSNISNNALGYFCACSVRKLSAIVP